MITTKKIPLLEKNLIKEEQEKKEKERIERERRAKKAEEHTKRKKLEAEEREKVEKREPILLTLKLLDYEYFLAIFKLIL